MASKRKWNPIENLLGFTNLREKKRKAGEKREVNHSINPEDKENVGAVVTQVEPLTVFKDIRT